MYLTLIQEYLDILVRGGDLLHGTNRYIQVTNQK